MSKDEKIAIKVENVSKHFLLPHQKASTLKSFFLNPFTKFENEKQMALNDISFEVKKGEFFGIVGRNGSGKSTLLKCIAGIYTPDSGHIVGKGKLVPFIELGVGFNPELSGRDNVYLNGSLLGFSRSEIDGLYNDIVEFSELDRFMDQKLKNYSSGMQVRLAFSIAIQARSDILLLDEVLAVGDSAFQQKCNNYFSSIKGKKTVILVSHNMQAIEKFCDTALLLDNGEIKIIGKSSEIASLYEEMFLSEEIQKRERKRGVNDEHPSTESLIKLKNIKTLQNGKQTKKINAKESLTIEVDIESQHNIKNAIVGINIKNKDRIMLVSVDTLEELKELELSKSKITTIYFDVENIFSNGLYSINIGVADSVEGDENVIYRKENAYEFIVAGAPSRHRSIARPKIKVRTH